MRLFSRKPKPSQEQTIIIQNKVEIETRYIYPEELKYLQPVGKTTDGEPVFRWRPPDRHVDKRITLKRE